MVSTAFVNIKLVHFNAIAKKVLQNIYFSIHCIKIMYKNQICSTPTKDQTNCLGQLLMIYVSQIGVHRYNDTIWTGLNDINSVSFDWSEEAQKYSNIFGAQTAYISEHFVMFLNIKSQTKTWNKLFSGTHCIKNEFCKLFTRLVQYNKFKSNVST